MVGIPAVEGIPAVGGIPAVEGMAAEVCLLRLVEQPDNSFGLFFSTETQISSLPIFILCSRNFVHA